MIGEDWMQRGVGALVVAGITAVAGFVKWVMTRKRADARDDAETDGIRASVLLKQAEADELRRVAVNGAYRGALETASSLVDAVRSEMDRLKDDLSQVRDERDEALVELRACRREAHALRSEIETLKREMDLVRRQLDEERSRRDEIEGRLSSMMGGKHV